MPTFTHGKATKTLVEGVDLSSFFKEYGYSAKMDTAETSTFGTTTKTYVQGMSDATLSLSGYFDGAAGAVDAILAAAIGASSNAEVTISPTGSFAIGSRVIAGTAIQSDYSVTGSIGSVVEVAAAFQGDGTIKGGVSLHDLVAETAAGNGTSVDNTNLTTGGGLLIVHVTANTMTAGTTIKVATSLDNTTFADFASVVVPTATTGGFYARVLAGTTANRYARSAITLAGTGSITFQSSFIRL